MEILKQCSKCKQQKPATLEYFPFRKDYNTLHSFCRVCKAEAARKTLAKRKAKDPDAFRADKRERARKDRAKNPEKARERVRASRARQKVEDPEGFAARARELARRQKAKNPEKVRERDRARRARQKVENPEELYERDRASRERQKLANPEKFREMQRESRVRFKAKHPERVRQISRARKARRKARKQGLPDTLTKAQWQYALDWWNGCAYCGVSLPVTELTLDHVIPFASPDCPGTTADNVVPACKHCNISKNARPLKDFLERKFGHTHMVSRMEMIAIYFSSLSK